MGNRNKILLGLSSIAIIIFVIIMILFNLNSYKVSKTFATNINYPSLTNNRVQYFTGSSFAELDVNNGSTRRISPPLILPEVLEMKWSEDGVIFQATNYSPADDLYQKILDASLTPETSYWWIHDFKTNKTSLLYDPVSLRAAEDAIWTKDNELLYFLPPDGEIADKVYTDFYIRDKQGKDKKILSYPYTGREKITRVLGKNNEEVYVISEIDLSQRLSRIEIDKNPKEEIIDENVQREVAVDEVGKQFLTSNISKDKNEGTEKLRFSDIYLIIDGKKTKVTEGFSGESRWDSTLNAFITLGQNYKGENKVLITNSEKKISIDIDEAAGEELTLNDVLVNNINEMLLVNEDTEILYYSKKQRNNLPDIQDSSKIHGDFYEDEFSINYFPDTNSYNVYITKEPFSKNTEKVYDYIKGQGIDPNQLWLNFYPYDDVNRNS